MTKLTYTRNEVEELMQLEAKFERERIIKLLEEQYDNFDENGKCVYLRHMPECCNCDLIALIKGENNEWVLPF